MRRADQVASMGESRSAYSLLVGRPEGRRQLGRSRPRLEDNIKTILKKWDGGVNWIALAQERGRWRALVNAVMKLRVP